MTDKDLYFYEPSKGHGLKHDPFNAIIAPRPIGWISSRDTKGHVNLAPYSFFNAFCYVPPIIGFSSTNWKDTVENMQQTGEFVWNLATMDLAKHMNATAAHVAPEVDEFKLAGLTAVPGKLVNVPRVGESPVAFECKVSDIVPPQGRRRQGGRRLADVRGGRRRPHRQGPDQGRRLPDRRRPPDRPRRPPRRLFRDQA
ncbi:flavin reductase (DIM6/NTAB) family NADH-FMN oxidoreductase RutF [Bradyrhizobium liaoningense]